MHTEMTAPALGKTEVINLVSDDEDESVYTYEEGGT